MSRSEHIEGLELARLTPADVEYFFRTLLRGSLDQQAKINDLS